jgi:hypothetical protein
MPHGSLGQPAIEPVIYPPEGGECQESRDAQLYLSNVMHQTTPYRPDGDVNRTRLNPRLRNLVTAGMMTFTGADAIRALMESEKPLSRRSILYGLLGSIVGAGAISLTIPSNPAYAKQPNTPKTPGIVQIYCQGGKDIRFGDRWPGATNNQVGDIKAPPDGIPAAPVGFQQVPDGKGAGGTINIVKKRGNQTLSIAYDGESNGHATGTERAFTGSDDTMSASLDAQLAKAYGDNDPYALVTGGGLTFPGMLVVPAKVTDINQAALLADPNNGGIVPDSLEEYLVAARKKEMAQYASGHEMHVDLNGNDVTSTVLPTAQNIGKDREVAQGAGDHIKEMLAIVQKFNAQKGNPIGQFLIIVTELMRDGTVAAASTQIGGHDTHGSKDGAQQMILEDTLSKGLDAGHTYAETANFYLQTQRISEFSRRPTDPNNLNNGDPSAHNSISEVQYMGAGVPTGGIAIGQLDVRGLDLIGEHSNFADVMDYRMKAAGLPKLPNVNVSAMTGTDVVQNYILKKTGQLMDFPERRGYPTDPLGTRNKMRQVVKRWFINLRESMNA